MRITAACPARMRDDANHLAMALAYGPADGLTYPEPNWQTIDGASFSASSFVARSEWIAAARAQEALVFWDGTGNIPQARISTLTAIRGENARASLALMGNQYF